LLVCLECHSDVGDYSLLHLVHPLLWDVGNLDMLLKGFFEIHDLVFESLTLFGFLESFTSDVNTSPLLIGESSLESVMEVLVPVGSLKVVVLLLDIIDLSLESVHLAVVDFDAVFSWLDGFVESLSEVLPLLHQLLSVSRCLEFLVKSLKVLNLSRSSPLLKSLSQAKSNIRVLDFMPDFFDVFSLILDGLLSFWGNLDLETVHLLLPLSWDFGNLNVFLKGTSELHNLFTEDVSSLGFFECLSSFLKVSECWACEEVLVGCIVFFAPVGTSKVLVVVRNIIELLGNLVVQPKVVDFDTIFGWFDGFLELTTDILPFLDEFLSSWGFHELFVKFVDSCDRSGVGELFESLLELHGGWPFLDFVGSFLDVHTFLLDALLSIWGDVDLEGVHGITVVSGDDTSGGNDSSGFHLFFLI